jgi:hypothetical protein
MAVAMVIFAVSGSRVSPTMMTSGSMAQDRAQHAREREVDAADSPGSASRRGCGTRWVFDGDDLAVDVLISESAA